LGQDDSGQNDFGRNDLGQDDLGQNDFGQDDLGQDNSGRNDFGQNDLGQDDSGQNNFGQDEFEDPETVRIVRSWRGAWRSAHCALRSNEVKNQVYFIKMSALSKKTLTANYAY
jgi:hypothetical protein